MHYASSRIVCARICRAVTKFRRSIFPKVPKLDTLMPRRKTSAGENVKYFVAVNQEFHRESPAVCAVRGSDVDWSGRARSFVFNQIASCVSPSRTRFFAPLTLHSIAWAISSNFKPPKNRTESETFFHRDHDPGACNEHPRLHTNHTNRAAHSGSRTGARRTCKSPCALIGAV